MSFTQTDVNAYPILFVSARCTMNPDEISSVMGRAFQTLEDFFGKNHIVPVGPPLSVYKD